MAPTRRDLLALAGLALAGAPAGCLGDAPGPGGSAELPAPDLELNADADVDEADLERLVAGNTAFAFDLLDALVERAPGDNLFVSPYSISIALAMTFAGARGETEDQMADALRFGLDRGTLHPAFNALAYELAGRGNADVDEDEGDPFALNVVNALWGPEEYPYRESFLDTVETNYGAGLIPTDFEGDPEGSRETINGWVEEHTEGKVDEVLPEGSIDALTRLVLTNAIYFRATWDETFDEDATRDATFAALDGSTATVPLMRQSAPFPYAEIDGAQVIELPYVGEEVSMVVVLPPEGEFESFEADLDGARLADLIGELDRREGRIELPRFEFETSVGLKEVLGTLGMPVAFDEREANFDGMIDLDAAGENVFVDDVYHDAHVAVDEEGTEAAAATAVVMRADSAPADPFEMTVDRPFLFAVRDRPTESVLFLGRVVDPNAMG